LRTDEKAIRAQSAILDEPLNMLPLLTRTAFAVRMPYIRTANAVGARRAQEHRLH
jgi:hypothetical protein